MKKIKDITNFAYSMSQKEWVIAFANLKQEIEQHDRKFHETGYQAIFRADLLRMAGFKLAKNIPDHAMVTLSEQKPMVINW